MKKRIVRRRGIFVNTVLILMKLDIISQQTDFVVISNEIMKFFGQARKIKLVRQPKISHKEQLKNSILIIFKKKELRDLKKKSFSEW